MKIQDALYVEIDGCVCASCFDYSDEYFDILEEARKRGIDVVVVHDKEGNFRRII